MHTSGSSAELLRIVCVDERKSGKEGVDLLFEEDRPFVESDGNPRSIDRTKDATSFSPLPSRSRARRTDFRKAKIPLLDKGCCQGNGRVGSPARRVYRSDLSISRFRNKIDKV
ncbi:hypothetical protein TNIN_151021 [Trichonephila inaurata madagascariensis]|uniref:Uncharacterized protein n=1 Tax=Trichonephila inaurata madagascariensis TaxID=2747483 RepID=A0A8X6Y1G7_9ARAC|nr:hypothetical protein TNIN_151021 [Trichonephila inaurata madagascariensis]